MLDSPGSTPRPFQTKPLGENTKMNLEQNQQPMRNRANMVYVALSDIISRPDVQKVQCMRQLESSVNLESSWWIKNEEKLHDATLTTVSLLPGDVAPDNVRITALIALRTIIKAALSLPQTPKIIQTITTLHL